jgi:lipoyl(octanoyl) transferase
MKYSLIDLGLVDYKDAYAFQKKALSQVKSGILGGVLIFNEHRPVFTIGRSGKKNNFLLQPDVLDSCNVDIINVDRGGDITFHGPGQMVVYPVFDLSRHTKDLHKYLRDLEEVIIIVLSKYGISSFRMKDRTGCWAEKGKIASIGISVSGWVAYHGLALNANIDLHYFNMINPCGLTDIKMVSMRSILNQEVDLTQLKSRLIAGFKEVFGIEFRQESVKMP